MINEILKKKKNLQDYCAGSPIIYDKTFFIYSDYSSLHLERTDEHIMTSVTIEVPEVLYHRIKYFCQAQLQ